MSKKPTRHNPPDGGTDPARGHIFIISAPSGAGKTTLCRALRRQLPELQYSISYTTRAPRHGEQNGVDYHFISPDEFRKRLRLGLWAEWAEVYGNYYGTSAEFLERIIAAGHDVLLDIDVQGAAQIVKRFPESVTIFVMPPSMEALTQRLTARGTGSAEDTKRRLDSAAMEIARNRLYRHVIVNDALDTAVQELTDLVTAYRNGTIPTLASTQPDATGPA